MYLSLLKKLVIFLFLIGNSLLLLIFSGTALNTSGSSLPEIALAGVFLMTIFTLGDRLILAAAGATPFKTSAPLNNTLANLCCRLGLEKIKLYQSVKLPPNVYYLDPPQGTPSLIISKQLLEELDNSQIRLLTFEGLKKIKKGQGKFKILVGLTLFPFYIPAIVLDYLQKYQSRRQSQHQGQRQGQHQQQPASKGPANQLLYYLNIIVHFFLFPIDYFKDILFEDTESESESLLTNKELIPIYHNITLQEASGRKTMMEYILDNMSVMRKKRNNLFSSLIGNHPNL